MKYGKIDAEYFNMKNYPADSAAAALILGDYGETIIDYDRIDGFVMRHTRHFRAKIFNKDGYSLATHGNVLYDFEGVTEKVSSFRASSYNMENGKIVESKVEKEMIQDEQVDRRRSMRKFTFPNVKEGTILEFELTIKSNFFQIPDWDFQYEVPALFSEYNIIYPEYFRYKLLQTGFLSFDVNTSFIKTINVSIPQNEMKFGSNKNTLTYDNFSYKETNLRYRIDTVPALREEPFMNSLSNYLSGIRIELASFHPPGGIERYFTRTWENINTELLEDPDFGIQLKKGGFLKEQVGKINSESSDPDQKIIRAFELVRNNMKWNGLNRLYVSQNIDKCWEVQSGSSAEINLLLVTLLKELGLDADPVIISTRSNGIIHPGQVMLTQFNYVLASVKSGEKIYLLDATEKSCPPDLLTPRCLNGQGRVISATRPDWIDLKSSVRFERTTIVNASIEADGTIKGEIQRQYGNYAALDKRNEIAGMKDIEEYRKSLEDKYTGFTISDYTTLDVDKLSMPLGEKMVVEIKDRAELAGNLITITPVLFREWEYNPFKLESRKFPVDYTHPYFIKDIATYKIPEGFIIDEKPQDIVLTMPEGKGKFSFRVAVNGNSIQLMSTLDISKALYTTEDYITLKEFYNNVVQKQSEKIVLKKAI